MSDHQWQPCGNHLELPADLQRLEPACRCGRGWLHWPELAESDQVRNWLALVIVERVVPDEAGHQRSPEECAGAVGSAGAVCASVSYSTSTSGESRGADLIDKGTRMTVAGKKLPRSPDSCIAT